MDKKRKRILLVCAAVVIVFLASNYWSYRIAVGSSQEIQIVTLTPLIKMQYECLQKNDIECVKKTNELLLDMLAAQMKAHKDAKMAGSLKAFIDENLKWYESFKNQQANPNKALNSDRR